MQGTTELLPKTELSKCQKLFKTFDFRGAFNGVDKKLPPKLQFNILWVVEVRTLSNLLEVVEAVIGDEAEGWGECLIMQSFNDIFPQFFSKYVLFYLSKLLDLGRFS